MMKTFVLAITHIALAAMPRAQTPDADTSRLGVFVAELQRAVAADDRSAVAAMVRYPITIAISDGLRVPFADARSLVERYDDIFNPPLRETIARAPVSMVIGTGDVMIEQVSGQLRITSIRVPPFTGDGPAAVVLPGDASRGVARPQEPRRVAIRVGPRPTLIPGTLLRNTTDTLVLFLPKGKLAEIRLQRVPAGAAAIRVVHARTGAPLSGRVSADGRFVSGRPSENGDYRIEVRWTGDADEGHLPYMLALSLR